MYLSVVIPAYNEAENLLKTVTELYHQITLVDSLKNYGIVICDDYSDDNTGEVIREMNIMYSNQIMI